MSNDQQPKSKKNEIWCERMQDLPFTYRLIPPDLDMYPTVILSNETTAVIGVNPKRGFVLHSDGAKTDLIDLQKLIIDNINLPCGVSPWAIEWIEKTYKKKYVDWVEMERARYFKYVEEEYYKPEYRYK